MRHVLFYWVIVTLVAMVGADSQGDTLSSYRTREAAEDTSAEFGHISVPPQTARTSGVSLLEKGVAGARFISKRIEDMLGKVVAEVLPGDASSEQPDETKRLVYISGAGVLGPALAFDVRWDRQEADQPQQAELVIEFEATLRTTDERQLWPVPPVFGTPPVYVVRACAPGTVDLAGKSGVVPATEVLGAVTTLRPWRPKGSTQARIGLFGRRTGKELPTTRVSNWLRTIVEF